jgi:hypothetical protein
MGSPRGARQPLAGKARRSKEESGFRMEAGVARALGRAKRLSLHPRPSDGLEPGRLSRRKSDEAAVHLRQPLEKDRDVDILVVVARMWTFILIKFA